MNAYTNTLTPRAKLGLVIGAVLVSAAAVDRAAAALFEAALRAIA